tara:strand:- start:10025 stop:11161 length:1137 start_codon:yes stop_codon:yes gene_type:complete
MATRMRHGNRLVTSIVNTADDRLQPGIDPTGGAPRHVKPVVAVGLLLLGLMAAALTFVRLPYFIFRPGTVNALSERIVVFKGESFPASGEVYFTTVQQDSTVNGWEYLWATVDDSSLVVNQEDVLGERSRDENREFNIELMRVSKSTAEAVALRHLGLDPFVATGVGMATVHDPAAEYLTTDDVIVAIDGIATMHVEELVALVKGRFPGDEIEILVEDLDGDNLRTVVVELAAREDDPTVGFLGIGPQTRWEDVDDLPVDVGIRTDKVGGNSAGLALTLAILEVLTPGELTAGLRVATTGTIDIDGVVGPIGGIRQKVFAARQAGIDLFLVPEHEASDARDVAGDLRVEGVGNLEDALAVLAELGGNANTLALPSASG